MDPELAEQVTSRAAPLPEEQVAERGDEDRCAAAATILAESEERLAGAVDGDAPGDAANEHRRSADTA